MALCRRADDGRGHERTAADGHRRLWQAVAEDHGFAACACMCRGNTASSRSRASSRSASWRSGRIGFWEVLQASEYGFWANVNPEVSHPRWSQAQEQLLGSDERIPTLLFNGYGEQVAEALCRVGEGTALHVKKKGRTTRSGPRSSSRALRVGDAFGAGEGKSRAADDTRGGSNVR